MNLGGAIGGVGKGYLGFQQGRQEKLADNAQKEEAVKQMMFRLALEKAARDQTQANTDRSFGETNRHNTALEAAAMTRANAPRVPTSRNIDPLSPEGIEAAIQRETALSVLPRRGQTYGGGKSSDTEETVLADGTVVQGKPPKITEAQGKAAVNVSVAENEEQAINDMQNSLPNKYVAKISVLGNILTGKTNPEFQAQKAAGDRWINQYLRFQSGAAISESEFENARNQFIPQPGDTPETIAAKALARKRVVEGMKGAAGPARPAQDVRNDRPMTPTAIARGDNLNDADYWEMLKGEGMTDAAATLKVVARRNKRAKK